MKKLLLLTLLFAVNAQAADFSPTPMTITVPAQIDYKFGGAPLEIPFTLTGKAAALWLVINTHGQSENIKAVRNGYLGWHYVNKIDTTIYISQKFERTPGENTITWDGKDENGNIPIPGNYDFYLGGYDNKSERELVCNFIQIGYGNFYQAAQIYEKGPDGLPLANPFIMGNQSFLLSKDDKELYRRTGTHYKWIIGSTPDDISLLQTSLCKMYFPQVNDGTSENFLGYSGPVLDPRDYDTFYHVSRKNIIKEDPVRHNKYIQPVVTVLKWEFVSSGEAVLNQDWGGWSNIMWEDDSSAMLEYPNCFKDDNYIYIPSSGTTRIDEWNKVRCINYDGEIVFDKLFHEWFNPSFYRPNGSIDKMYSRTKNNWLLVSNFGCMHQMINTSRLLDDPDDETDMVIFTNSNGDYFLDNGWKANIEHPWFCVPEISTTVAMNNSIYKNSIVIDSNNFNIFFIGNYGITSFGVSTQDGTGIGYMNFADDIANSQYGYKGGGQLCDSGSAYDGLYIHGKTDPNKHWTEYAQTYYVAFDSAHGMITNEIAVEEKNPNQFKVNQNSPNPFNPSTTIAFTLPEKGNVNIDIYNVAGQKVKTLVNGYMSEGEHSVRWDASGCSAGVYFYKVKAGKYERSMKMTLVR